MTVGPLGLQRLQEVNQILRLLLRQTDLEPVVVKINDLLKIRCNSVMKVRGARGYPSQDKSLPSSNIAALTADQGFARIRRVIAGPGQRPLRAR